MPLADAYDQDQLVIEWTETDPITCNPSIRLSDMKIMSLEPGTCDGNYSTGSV